MSPKFNQYLNNTDNIVFFDDYAAAAMQDDDISQLVNNATDTQSKLNAFASLQGHFVFDGNNGLFLLDEVCCAIVCVEDHHQWHPVQDVIKYSSNFDIHRFAINTTSNTLGDTIFERINIIDGPYRGQTFIIQGSVLERSPSGQALWIVGTISHEMSPFSEFLAREMSGDGLFMWEGVDNNIVCSASMLDMLGYCEHEFPNNLIDLINEIVHPDDNDFLLIMRQFRLSNQYGNYFESCLRLKHKKGHYIWTIFRSLIQERDANGIGIKGIGSITDINLVKDSFENIKLMLFTDSLTGLHNRNYFQQNYMRYEAKKLHPLSVIYLDVSGLKLTNDILGHSYGDYLLTKTADIVKEAVRNATGTDINNQDYEHHHQDGVSPSPLPEHFFGTNDEWNDGEFCAVNSQMLGNSTAFKAPAEPTEPTDSQEPNEDDSYSTRPETAPVLELNLDVDPSYVTSNDDIGQTDPLTFEDFSKVSLDFALEDDFNIENIELLRLAGDEFLLILPKCSESVAQRVLMEIIKLKDELNDYNKNNVAIVDRPVPLCFGIGSATLGENGLEHDHLKNVIERADHRMQECKEQLRKHDYKILRRYFENKKGRPISMRDERRVNVLSEDDRIKLRRTRINNMMS